MISRHLYIQIFIRVLLLGLSALGVAWILFGAAANILVLVPVMILLFVFFNLIHYLNRVNRRIYFFFDAIRNEDSSLSFPEEQQTGIEKDLSHSMKEVNRRIQRIYGENQKQEQYFQALIGHAATGMFTYNKNGFILHSNSQARQLFGLEHFTHLSQLEAVDSKLYRLVEKIRPGKQQLTALSREDEVVQLLIKASAFLSEGEELMILSVQDIRNELDQKEVDSWRKLIRVMRHEMMNSVTPIISLSESLGNYFFADGKVKEPGQVDRKTIDTTLSGLELIHEQAKGLMRFVESYQQLTRMPEPEMRSFPVRNLMENIRMLAQSFPNAGRTELLIEIEPGDLELVADEKQISQVMVNLVKNAFQSTELMDGARVNIRADFDSNGRPRIMVTDNGPGISDDLMDKIFIPFFTTREKGSGIGLSLSRQIMQLHGGSLKIHSVQGKQTSMVLLFK